jgi:hypothetical protein
MIFRSQEKIMILAISYATAFALLAFGIACLTDWLVEITAPYSKIPVKMQAAGGEKGKLIRRHCAPLNHRKPNLRHQVEIRELPFLC